MNKNLEWVIKELPENHKDMIFVYLDCGKCSFYFLKEKSIINIFNDPSNFVCKILKSIRDNKNYIKKLLKIKYNLNTFKNAKSKKTFRSDLDESINTYILYKLSKKNEGNIYEKSNFDKNSINCNVNDLSILSKKIDNDTTFIFNYSLKESLKIFNNEDIVIYYAPNIKEVQNPEHLEIITLLNKSYSKIILNTYDNPIYKKYLKNWTKKKRPNQINKIKVDCIWKNF